MTDLIGAVVTCVGVTLCAAYLTGCGAVPIGSLGGFGLGLVPSIQFVTSNPITLFDTKTNETKETHGKSKSKSKSKAK